MKVAVISDLHLGLGDRTESFGHDDGEFLRFLDFLEGNFERVVLLGDVWETLTSRFPGRAERALADARLAHPELARRFDQPKYSYVFGNHDLVAGRVLSAPEELTLEADGVRLLFAHGHQSDGLIRTARSVSELGVWLGGWIKRFGFAAFYRVCRRLDELRSGTTRTRATEGLQRWAVEHARRGAADVVVTGHTHLATRVECGDRLFLNSGSCSEGQLSYVAMDTRRGDYAVCRSW